MSRLITTKKSAIACLIAITAVGICSPTSSSARTTYQQQASINSPYYTNVRAANSGAVYYHYDSYVQPRASNNRKFIRYNNGGNRYSGNSYNNNVGGNIYTPAPVYNRNTPAQESVYNLDQLHHFY